MTSNAPRDYERLLEEAEKRAREAQEKAHGAQQEAREAKEKLRQAEEQQRLTNFDEFIRYCHNLYREPKVADSARSTTGTIPLPKRKYCPARLVPWEDGPSQLQKAYDSICGYLRSGDNAAPRVFSSLIAMEEIRRQVMAQPISSEQGLLLYDRLTRESPIRDIVAQLCKIPAAQQEFNLGDGIEFESHTNALERSEMGKELDSQLPTIDKPVPDVFFISRVNGQARSITLTCEQKPPHKLPVETIRAGLRPMNLWEELVRSNKIPTDPAEKTRYDAARLVCSAAVQEFHVMINEGLPFSYLTTGPDSLVIFEVPEDDPSTLHYIHYEPRTQGDVDDDDTIKRPITSVTSILCLLIMSLHSSPRSQEWRNWARSRLNVWETSFDSVRSTIAKGDQGQDSQLPSSETEHPSPETGSEYLPSSSPSANKDTGTRSQARCAPSDEDNQKRGTSPDSSASDADQTKPTRKRGFSSVSTSCQSARQRDCPVPKGYQPPHHDAEFCSIACILGLRDKKPLDDNCPNVKRHRLDFHSSCHSISADELVQKLKEQLNNNIDANCTPFADRGAYGVPFKLTLSVHGYTVVGKGTSRELWDEVSMEIPAYRLLQVCQGSAVPVYLGSIDLEKSYHVTGAGHIHHMLVMSYGGEEISQHQHDRLKNEIRRSVKEVKRCGVNHGDLRTKNMLWNKQSGRVVIIDFHRARVERRLCATQGLKRKEAQSRVRPTKRVRAA